MIMQHACQQHKIKVISTPMEYCLGCSTCGLSFLPCCRDDPTSSRPTDVVVAKGPASWQSPSLLVGKFIKRGDAGSHCCVMIKQLGLIASESTMFEFEDARGDTLTFEYSYNPSCCEEMQGRNCKDHHCTASRNGQETELYVVKKNGVVTARAHGYKTSNLFWGIVPTGGYWQCYDEICCFQCRKPPQLKGVSASKCTAHLPTTNTDLASRINPLPSSCPHAAAATDQ